uniref:Macaca fascicularis brain cDNA clone: QtrA-16684, similar to human protein kinase C, zeta (PRKCZ), mRNA, RefSeq: NM_002744.2 n=1 Tax=Macaca fascicularis TaxID=9541 RepID=I7GPI0_MACFA|nr:unnamed protein product [Macaca fascicularis]
MTRTRTPTFLPRRQMELLTFPHPGNMTALKTTLRTLSQLSMGWMESKSLRGSGCRTST